VTAPIGPTTPIPTASNRMNEMVDYVRLFLRDFPELNRLTQGYEHSPRMIAWAIIDTLDDWNSTPPFVGNVGITNMPSRHLICRGATISLLESVGLLQTRNQLTFSDGGLTVTVGQPQLILQWLSMFKASYEQKKARFKASQNIELAMDGAGTFSEYFVINGIYLTEV
jgi:hypothetical protein